MPEVDLQRGRKPLNVVQTQSLTEKPVYKRTKSLSKSTKDLD